MNNYLQYDFTPGPIKARDIMVMHGANYFSGGPVVVIKLDLGEYDEVFTNEIPGFYEKLRRLVPSLHEHHCSPGFEGGFFLRVKEGTLLGHVTEHLAIELQTLAGMDVSYGKTRATIIPGVYNVVFRFLDEVAGVYAGKAAVNLVNSILTGAPFDVDRIVEDLVDIREKRLLGPTTQAIVDEAGKRGIPFLRLDRYNLVQLGTGRHQRRIRASISSETGFVAVETVDDKQLTCTMLGDAGIPVPQTAEGSSAEEVIAFQHRISKPVTVKPRVGSQGRGISINLSTPEQIHRAFDWSQTFHPDTLAQETVYGNAWRLLIIDYRYVAAVKLTPPAITGDGRHTIQELVDLLNQDPKRGVGDRARLSRVTVDDVTRQIIGDAGYSLETVLPEKETLPLKHSGSLALGGSAVDVTDEVHPVNRFLAERAARVVGLNAAGVDVIAPTLRTSLLENNGRFIEINSAPDFRMHIRPTVGRGRNVAGPFVDMLFPEGNASHVPIFSVTGSFGKSELVDLLSHCLTLNGHITGMAWSQGLFLSGQCMKKGDMTAPENVQLILREPTIDSAVLETPCEGILRRGLGYERADYGIVLNMHPREIDCDYARDIEDVAYAKSTVAELIYDQGASILNADNDLVLEMAERAGGRVVLFSRDSDNPHLRAHFRDGGIAVIQDGDDLMILHHDRRLKVATVQELPIFQQMPDQYAADVILACIAALFVFGMAPEKIREGIASRQPG
jgi:cyanophycin synthetase